MTAKETTQQPKLKGKSRMGTETVEGIEGEKEKSTDQRRIGRDELTLESYRRILTQFNNDPRNNLKFIEAESAERMVAICNSKNELAIIGDDLAASMILRLGSIILHKNPDRQFLFKPSQAKEFLNYWIWETPAINVKDIKRISLMDDTDCYTYRRVPIERDTTVTVDQVENNCPIIMEIVSRMELPEEFVLWTGGMFLHGADNSQYFWLYGEGKDSKSSIVRLFKELMGPAFKASSSLNNRVNGRFWLQDKMDAGVIVFNDANNPELVQNELVKAITGGDTVAIERKNIGTITRRLSAKVMMCSNKKPRVKMTSADLRRALFCQIAPYVKPEGTPAISEGELTDLLMSEASLFINYCINRYIDELEGTKAIPEPKSGVKLAMEQDDELEDMVEINLHIGEGHCMTANDMQEFRRRLKSAGLYNSMSQKTYVKEYLKTHYGIDSESTVANIGGSSVRGYLGASLKVYADKTGQVIPEDPEFKKELLTALKAKRRGFSLVTD
jgi:hypothetical protein